MAQAEQQRRLLPVVEVPEVVEPLRQVVERLDVALTPEAEEVLVVDGVEEDGGHGLDGQAVQLRGEPQALDGGAARGRTRPGRSGAR